MHRLIPLLLFVSYVCPAYAQVTGSYMTQQSAQIALLRITQSGKTVTGYLQTVNADSQTITRPKRSEVKGVVSGSRIVLKMDSFFGQGGRDADGEIRGGKLYLEFPNSSGSIAKIIFSRTSTDNWNRTLSAFQARWTRSITSQREATAIADRKAFLEREDNRISLLVFALQCRLAGAMNLYEPLKQKLTEAETNVAELKKKEDEAEQIANKATDEADTPLQRAKAAQPRAKASETRERTREGEVRVHEAEQKFQQVRTSIERDKAEITKRVRIIRLLNQEMKQRKMESHEAPELGKYVGVVVVEMAKIREARVESSDVIGAAMRGAYIPVLGVNERDTFTQLLSGTPGVTARKNIRLVEINSLP